MGRGRKGVLITSGKKKVKRFIGPPLQTFQHKKIAKENNQTVILLSEEAIAQLKTFDKELVANLLTGN